MIKLIVCRMARLCVEESKEYQAFMHHFLSMGGQCWVAGAGMVGCGVVWYWVGWSMAVYSDRWWAGVVLCGLTWGGD